jgi:hypothetical protein
MASLKNTRTVKRLDITLLSLGIVIIWILVVLVTADEITFFRGLRPNEAFDKVRKRQTAMYVSIRRLDFIFCLCY